MRKYVIIGSGAAGIAAAEAIRAADGSGEILLISEERDGYYSRPGLAYLLTGEVGEEMLHPFSAADFEYLKLSRRHARVTSIDPHNHLVALDDHAAIPYDRLLLATGAAATVVQLPGVDLDGVVKLDNFVDARRIIRLARRARAAVVVGGGITALEIAEGLKARKVRTHYFLRRDRYWSNVLDERESKIVENLLVQEGIQVHYHTELAEILGQRGKVTGVRTVDGRHIRCGMVAIAVGIRPRLELARSAGLRTDRGVLVNEFMETSQAGIYAAGDVAQVYDSSTGSFVLDSLWGPARQQGQTAGANMAGARSAYQRGVPFNVTRLAGLTTTIIGTVGRGVDEDLVGIARGDSEIWRQLPDAIAAQEDFEVNRLRVLVGKRVILGAIVMGDQTLSQPLHHLIASQADITTIREGLLQPDGPVADLLADFWTSWSSSHATN